METLRKLFATAAVVSSLALTAGLGVPEALAANDCVRIAGQDRHETMSLVVSSSFDFSQYAVIVTSDNYPDALSASSLAGTLACPIILTTPGGLSRQASSELERLGTQSAYLIGGESALSAQVELDLAAMGIETVRVAGADRIQTSLSVLSEGLAHNNRPTTLLVATGYGFADSLSAGPYAYKTGSPIVLTSPDGTLTDQAVQAIRDSGAKEIILVGGDAVVSDVVKLQLGDNFSCVRLGGANRFETSARFADWSTTRGLGWSKPAFSTGQNYPDALAAAAMCGVNSSVLLLVQSPTDPTVSSVSSHASEVDKCYILGGVGAVSDAVKASIESALGLSREATSGLTYVLPHYTITLPEYWKGKVTVSTQLEGSVYPDGQVHDYEQIIVRALQKTDAFLDSFFSTGINPGEAIHENETFWSNGVWMGYYMFFDSTDDKNLIADLITGGQCTGSEDIQVIKEVAYAWLKDNVHVEWTSTDPMPEQPSWMR